MVLLRDGFLLFVVGMVLWFCTGCVVMSRHDYALHQQGWEGIGYMRGSAAATSMWEKSMTCEDELQLLKTKREEDLRLWAPRK